MTPLNGLSAIALATALAASASGALAQPADLIEIETDAQMVAPFEVSVDQLEDMNVMTADGETIGEIEEVLGTADGQPTALALEVGGFLGIGDKDVIVMLDQVTMVDGSISLDMTKEEIEALPEWND
ncbi:PRC-barrel domain-containing protein [Pararhizobium haloflavum]|uniref:PRC-barrel domain-containing protein n=1 Tax=Pararhizobium haloflavum TaxID=2037914 RepID=UPI000C190AF8|nr:PRC-barrel domain-containing protein [Pararhizobium haloflavum]